MTKAIIIAAGSGTRLDGLEDIPKSLLDINGESLLYRQVKLFKKFGIADSIVITGPNSQKFNLTGIRYVRDVNHLDHDILCSLMAAQSEISGEVIISYSDIIFDENIMEKIVDFEGDIGVVVDLDWKKAYENRKKHPISEAENVQISDNKILKIRKNISKNEKFQKIGEFLGIIKLSKLGAKMIIEKFNELEYSHKGKFHDAPSLKKAYLTDMIQELIDCDLKIIPILITGKWCEIDIEEDLERARKLF